jgi:acyl carrier protein
VSSPAEIRDQLAEVLHDVVGVDRSRIRDTASLEEVGVDSLARVEIADGLERRFSIKTPEIDVAEWRTVGDVVRTVSRQVALREHASLIPTPPSLTDPDQSTAFKQVALFFAVLGAAVGIGFGVVAAMMLASIGLPGGSMPERQPVHVPIQASDNADDGGPGAKPTVAPTSTPKAQLRASPLRVAPGQRFTLAGQLPKAQPGEKLQIQYRVGTESWQDFPVTVTAGQGGVFSTQLYTSRAGVLTFQVTSPSGGNTPDVGITIGRQEAGPSERPGFGDQLR